jgi:hypothetical protein
MAGRMRRPLSLAFPLVLILLAPPVLHAEDTGSYALEYLPDGTPCFTQVLRWEGNPSVLYYEVTLQTQTGEAISVTKVDKPELSVSLGPGRYRYKIAIYNTLRKLELELPWQAFTILKAEIPRITGYAPKVWFLEDLKPMIQINGDDLVDGATVCLKAASGAEIMGTERQREGTSMAKFEFPAGPIEAGEYSVELKNPGGISSTIDRGLLVRHMLAAPSGLSPSPGSVFGPKELRGLKSLRFSWDEVPEATHYIFRLYRGTETGPLARMDSSPDREYTLNDLAVLDRGEYRWTVEAIAKSGEEVVIPSAQAALSRFTIELPRLVSPALEIGDTFYGR